MSNSDNITWHAPLGGINNSTVTIGAVCHGCDATRALVPAINHTMSSATANSQSLGNGGPAR